MQQDNNIREDPGCSAYSTNHRLGKYRIYSNKYVQRLFNSETLGRSAY